MNLQSFLVELSPWLNSSLRFGFMELDPVDLGHIVIQDAGRTFIVASVISERRFHGDATNSHRSKAEANYRD